MKDELRTITINMDEDLHYKLKAISKDEHRQINGQALWFLEDSINRYERNQFREMTNTTLLEIELEENICKWLDKIKENSVSREEAIQNILFYYLRERVLTNLDQKTNDKDENTLEKVTINADRIRDFYNEIAQTFNEFIEDTL